MNYTLKMLLLQARHPIATAKLMTKLTAVVIEEPDNANLVLDVTVDFFKEIKREDLIAEHARQVLSKLDSIQSAAMKVGGYAAFTLELAVEFHKAFSEGNQQLRARLEALRAGFHA